MIRVYRLGSAEPFARAFEQEPACVAPDADEARRAILRDPRWTPRETETVRTALSDVGPGESADVVLAGQGALYRLYMRDRQEPEAPATPRDAFTSYPGAVVATVGVGAVAERFAEVLAFLGYTAAAYPCARADEAVPLVASIVARDPIAVVLEGSCPRPLVFAVLAECRRSGRAVVALGSWPAEDGPFDAVLVRPILTRRVTQCLDSAVANARASRGRTEPPLAAPPAA